MFDSNPPQFRFNNVFSVSGAAYGGICADQTGVNGNISADPLFVNSAAGDYHLQPTVLTESEPWNDLPFTVLPARATSRAPHAMPVVSIWNCNRRSSSPPPFTSLNLARAGAVAAGPKRTVDTSASVASKLSVERIATASTLRLRGLPSSASTIRRVGRLDYSIRVDSLNETKTAYDSTRTLACWVNSKKGGRMTRPPFDVAKIVRP